MKMIRSVLAFILFVIIGFACTKKEGEGGTAVIKGRVIVKLVSDSFDTTFAEFPDEERDVYIVYGDDDYYGDRTLTFFDGTYQFSYLRKGKYKVFAYSDDETGQSESGKRPVIKEVQIDKNGKIIDVPDIVVYNQVTNYEGSSTISGKIFAYDYTPELVLIDSFYVRDKWVHIARKGESYYFERQRSFYDGSFVFPSLPIGKYEVYVYGRDITAQDPQDLIPYIVEVEISENRQHVDVGRIDINI